MGRPEDPVFTHFFCLYKEEEAPAGVNRMKNKSHKAAWCIACLDAITTQIPSDPEEDSIDLCFVGPDGLRRARYRRAIPFIKPLRGVSDDLIKHLAKCEFVDPKVKKGIVVPGRNSEGEIQNHPQRQTTLKLETSRHYTDSQKEDFKRDFLRLIVGCNIAFVKADHPSMEEFCSKWIGLEPPSRTILSGRLLNLEKETIQEKNIDLLAAEHGGTLICDGWNNKKREHLVSFMLLTRHHSIPLRHFDNSSVSRTGQLAYEQILEVFSWLKDQKIDVYGVCTDDGPDQAKARRLLGNTHPEVITTPCWAHQINLIVKGFLVNTPIMENTDVKMGTLVRFFRGHDRIMAMLHQEMQMTGQKRLSLLRPVLTRWTSHFQACRRLNEVETSLRALLIRRRGDILGTMNNQDQGKVRSAKSTLRIIEDEAFWRRLHLMQRVLEPLAVAALVLQQHATRLDHVLLSLGKLYTEYQLIRRSSDDDEERHCCDTLMISLEERWKVADQDTFIAAVILNPFVGQQRLCFSHLIPEWQHNGVYNTLDRVYKRIFKEEAPGSLLEDYTDYRRRQGLFTTQNLKLQHFVDKANMLRQSPDPVAVWLCLDDEDVPLVRLALRIFSYIPTSADLERLFSHQSEIEGVKRIRLHRNRVADLAMIASDITSTHTKNRKRKYGSKDYAGDLFLSSKLQCVVGDDVDDDSAPAVLDSSTLDGEAHTRRWLHSINDTIDTVIGSDEPMEPVPASLIPLSTLFNTGSSSELITNLGEYMNQPWAVGTTMMEAETEYYTALLDPLSTATVPEFPTEQQ